jgi:hypothetical protein
MADVSDSGLRAKHAVLNRSERAAASMGNRGLRRKCGGSRDIIADYWLKPHDISTTQILVVQASACHVGTRADACLHVFRSVLGSELLLWSP